MNAENWQERARCRDSDRDLFFPTSPGAVNASPAKAICADCEVRPECLQWAVEHDERHGVWGGTSESERERMYRASRPYYQRRTA